MTIADQVPAEMLSDDEDEDVGSVSDYLSDTGLKIEPKYPPLNEAFDSTILVMNLPKIDASKYDKLKRVITKIFSRVGTLPEGGDSIIMPQSSSTSKSLGFAFVEYAAPEDARNAFQAVNDYPMDKNHRLRVIPYDDVRRLREIEPAFVPPEPEEAPDPVDTTSWLQDESQRDMFVVREGKNTVINWNDPSGAIVDYDGSRERAQGVNWCDYYVAWSPRGSYLATMHAKGVRLWGGKGYESIMRFMAEGVEDVSFSPCETYMMTNNFRPDDPAAVKIFDLESHKLLKSFGLFPKDFPKEVIAEEGEEPVVRPAPKFQWSFDDKYIARMGKDLISIYELPSLRLLDKRSVSAVGVAEFQWSPGANIIAYWAPEVRNSPAHVDLIEVPSRKFLRQKNLFHVSKCSMAWHSDGEYLGVKVLRHTKSKKTLFNNFELFRLNDPGIPVEMLEMKDAVMCFSWEPRGSRFAMIHAENPSSTKVNVSFYDMNKVIEAKKGKGGKMTAPQVRPELNKLETLEGKQCNQLFWSPAGRHIVLAGLGDSASGTLEFYDVVDRTLTVKEHYRATEVAWDPSGRTVITSVIQPIGGSYYKFQMDNGYILWSFQGKQLQQVSYEDFYQISWRPRENLLSKAERQKVVVNLKKYEKQFDQEDKRRARAKYIEDTRGKREERQAVRDRIARLSQFHRQQKAMRIELNGGYDSDDEENFETVVDTVETVVSVKEDFM
uniref:Eukaryotic translation initiation factor 3 subunit B n=1 Tax=Corethron hystrix TaxID=216773 RepID=A0A7S1BYA9_9STRA|mmetsp:Transcript_6704/g.14433  ORF Transcript_6704/g.14433 Transcript_6704/m.14433 type:complete len:720 (+) Transcript_6704:116-2275(+)|eukprot:CAMPEP_0113313282 /NCGR_PEP_ID=MMETSP0010_2-20120614/9768_1 /TAXON_ID=216773 ORGANISM="Corethron hystrix, Strain 308" /NCGR_SAMPLE_ID=MMETSP0010_2 /ASSEMBLY_ACC=CAM_ASM_000155 /LENGTH=719 /DNA_ID=CAMNT_0000169263 /DNA_START=72 /DNA_END=2231 /DNA_ORIENTATION=+ /assembly_acc=CAM_ASM_000155